ncbi:conserved hypothetical protein [Hyella patelloides LEGE 07179]|uniref:Plastid lipid-associated protein/fibrillin conserved domain-containing protein n=1 Tax=Hyella patelloides LEGE 07179 TaxID=945734 RepID=A0A563W0V6_9CYAN|nr:hypothetical protein [Hyella patelloides]VEP17173.1 conserved hypothetical protein [Hyella patelloides LEGE 07179]
MTSQQVLQEAALSALEKTNLKSPDEVVTALLAAEKEAKKQKFSYSFEQLIGTWRLCFITGTKKTRKRAGIVLGAGKYLPQFLKITITYKTIEDSEPNQGRVENCVDLKFFQLSLTGPIKFLTPQNILAFDFTKMQIKLLGLTIYNGYIRAGKAKEASFYSDSIKKQAFFTYFQIQEMAIAARGRGGGLALWTRVN